MMKKVQANDFETSMAQALAGPEKNALDAPRPEVRGGRHPHNDRRSPPFYYDLTVATPMAGNTYIETCAPDGRWIEIELRNHALLVVFDKPRKSADWLSGPEWTDALRRAKAILQGCPADR